MTIQAIACTLTADQRKCEAADLLPALSARADSIEWTPAGIRFSFSPQSDTLEAITHVIDRERRCCAFLTFRLEVTEGGGDFLLELSGPPGTREFLVDLLLPSSPPNTR